MKHWGKIITGFYAIVVIFLLAPLWGVLLVDKLNELRVISEIISFYKNEALVEVLVWLFIMLGSQALLLFLSVDTSHLRNRQRTHVMISIATAALLFAIMTYAVISSLIVGIESATNLVPDTLDFFVYGSSKNINTIGILFIWIVLWIIWSCLFYVYFRESSDLVTKFCTWLFRGSVLELLIAIPCHIIVRKNDECTSPMVTSFGVVTGIAIMLLSFGPSVYFLFKKRMNGYRKSPE